MGKESKIQGHSHAVCKLCVSQTECASQLRIYIGSAGIRLVVHLYGGKQTDGLKNLRYMKFMEMTSCNKKVVPEKLPPTERAAFFHSLTQR